MPLWRRATRPGMRFMLPVFPAFCAALAGRSVGLDVEGQWIEDLLPMRGWALLFASVGAGMLTAFVFHHRTAYQLCLAVLGLCMAFWAASFVYYGLSGASKEMAWVAVWPSFAALTCMGAIRSLEDSREEP